MKSFFPIFRDCILGLTFIHNKSIAHRDIKPDNIMKINDNSYKLADYGEGINLSFNQKNFKSADFQKGNFFIQGTPSYLDPALFQAYSDQQVIHEKVNIDIFKADIFSMGLTLIEMATGRRWKNVNKSVTE